MSGNLGPCSFGLAASKLSAVRVETRLSLLALLLKAKRKIERGECFNHNLKQVASAAGLSSCHFQRRYAEAFGVSPSRDILKAQISRSKVLLCSTAMSIKSVAIKCGFCSGCEFSRTFSREVGVAPKQFRKNCKN